jgi:putative FmdB family regulatory protein
MPIYEYKCQQCGHFIEKLRSIKSRDDPIVCCNCSAPMQRYLSMFNTLRKTNASNESTSLVEPVSIPSRKSSAVGIRFKGGSGSIKDCRFNNLQTGVSMAKGSKIDMQDNKFDNVTTPVEVKDE